MRVIFYGMSYISKYMYGKRLEWLLKGKNTHKVNLMKGEIFIASGGS